MHPHLMQGFAFCPPCAMFPGAETAPPGGAATPVTRVTVSVLSLRSTRAPLPITYERRPHTSAAKQPVVLWYTTWHMVDETKGDPKQTKQGSLCIQMHNMQLTTAERWRNQEPATSQSVCHVPARHPHGNSRALFFCFLHLTKSRTTTSPVPEEAGSMHARRSTPGRVHANKPRSPSQGA